MDIQAFLTYIDNVFPDMNLQILTEYLRQKQDIWVCDICYKPVDKNIYYCMPCSIAECGCKGSIGCCGYQPYQPYDK